jgi:hypothetical protein
MGLKIVYSVCCGIDVHKTFVVVCIASTTYFRLKLPRTFTICFDTKRTKNKLW